MSELDYGDIKEIADILLEHYYSIGVHNGLEAIGNLIDDYLNGYLDGNLVEWGIVDQDGKIDHMEFRGPIFWSVITYLFDEKKLFEDVSWIRSSKARTAS